MKESTRTLGERGKVPEPAQRLRRDMAGRMLQLQRTIGNRALADLVESARQPHDGRPKRLQAKLTVDASNDPLEQEADRIADQVLAAPSHSTGEARPRIRCHAGHGTDLIAPATVDRALAGPGSRLQPALQEDMEDRFGHDFSRVRVHSGEAAEQSARDLNARAYTVGDNIVFGAGQFAPASDEGRRLIAHELTHVAQQSAAPPRPRVQRKEENNAGLGAISGLPMSQLLARLSALPEAILEDEEAGTFAGGARLVVAMRAVRAKRAKALVAFLTVNKQSLEALPNDAAAIVGFMATPDDSHSQQSVNIDLEVDVTIVSPAGVQLRGESEKQVEGGIRAAAPSSPESISEFEERLLNDRTKISGVVLDPDTREIIGYRTLYADGISTLVDREGDFVVDAGIPLGVESEGLGPGDYLPSPKAAAKGVFKAGATIVGKLMVKGALKKGIASGGKVTLGAILRMRGVSRAVSARGIKGLAAGGIKRFVGRTGASAFGEIRFIGLIRNRALQDLTHNEIYAAFKGTAYRLSNHAIMRLKDPRTRALGITTLAHVEQLFNKGIIQESRGLASIQFGSLEAIVNAATGVVVTISPL